MARVWKTVAVAGAALVALVAVSCHAGVQVGDPAPNWAAIPGVDGKDHSLADYKDAKLVVLVFTCNHCPVAVNYEDRLVALQKDYEAKGVQFVAICVNDRDEDRLEPMKARAKEKGFNFPYLYDESQKTAKDYGAKNTPHLFVLGKDRKVVYIGGIDDNHQNPKAVTKQYLRDALDALLAGKEPPQAETPHPGCGIKWAKKSP